jgi:hypothetical protein
MRAACGYNALFTWQVRCAIDVATTPGLISTTRTPNAFVSPARPSHPPHKSRRKEKMFHVGEILDWC